MLRSFRTANSMVEYVIPLALVGALVVITVVSISGNFRGGLNGFFNSDPLVGQEKTLNIRPAGVNPYLQTLKLVLSDGTVITVPNYPSSLSKAIEVDGGNGTTEHLAEGIRQLALQLKDQGKITDDQFNRLQELANAGHLQASTQRLLEEAAGSAGSDKNAFASKQINVDGGGNRTLIEVGNLLSIADSRLAGSPETKPLPPSLKGSFETLLPNAENQLKDIRFFDGPQDIYVGNQLLGFLESYQNAKDSGVLADQDVDTLVTQLSKNILHISIATHVATNATSYSQSDIKTQEGSQFFDFSNVTPDKFRGTMASNVTDSHSAAICNADGGEDTGIHCPK